MSTHTTLTRLALGRLHSERTAAARTDQRLTTALTRSNDAQDRDVEAARRIAAGRVAALINGGQEH